MILFLKRLNFKLHHKQTDDKKVEVNINDEIKNNIPNNKLTETTIASYLALNHDLFTLLEDDKIQLKEAKNLLNDHFVNHGKDENRLVSINEYSKLFASELQEKELANLKKSFASKHAEELRYFLKESIKIKIPHNPTKPTISVILVLHNKAPLSFACIKSISQCLDCSIELIVVDNNSKDETVMLTSLITGRVKILRNSNNDHFLSACNQALKEVTGEYIALVNNDTVLDPLIFQNAINTYVDNINLRPIVGGMITHIDGKLQEAGSMILEDGSTFGVGRRCDSTSFMYNYQRPVHYVSGCFLFTHIDIYKN